MNEIKERIRTFLNRFFRKHTIEDDEDIFSLGFVNSLFAMQLILFLEKEFSISIQSEDMDLNNFRTLNSLACIVSSKINLTCNE